MRQLLTFLLALTCLTSSAMDDKERKERGTQAVAALWQEKDGSKAQMEEFCAAEFRASGQKLDELFLDLQRNFETLWGYGGLISWRLNEAIDVKSEREISPVNRIFANYSPMVHLNSDLYQNKIAFIVALNFPAYTLAEKTELGTKWTQKEWAMARMGEVFDAQIPSSLNQSYNETLGNAGMYISDYNIMMGRLRTEDGRQLFPDSMALLSHWNLRDEIKSAYADKENGLEKQRMIYQVMCRIIDQTIPRAVINNQTYTWKPYSNQTTAPDKTSEDTMRYAHLRRIFNENLKRDPYYGTTKNTYIKRNFDGGMEISKEQVKAMFEKLVGSEIAPKIGKIISTRLGRKLMPHDLWYDGFKSRSKLDFSMLDSMTASRFPTAAAVEKDVVNILTDLGYNAERAQYLASKIAVDPARGSGHAMGATIRGGMSRLRTRIADQGMDYKGYNIAIHELGHNVEQTISLYDVDNYMVSGVPNTSFTEALAFSFQSRDLQLLGLQNSASTDDKLYDNFWDVYEIMGVSLVDMELWDWMYEHKNATANEIKLSLIEISKNVWNKYYAPVFGVRDVTLLGVYSHMISYPLYLSAYPFGLLIHFQLENHWAGMSPKELTQDIDRIYRLGRLAPNVWMQKAVGEDVSVDGLLNKLREKLTIK
ncbi:MAG: hypothetical protein RR485_00100 [Mucinivorans sp.]